jgi:hypothetical protein
MEHIIAVAFLTQVFRVLDGVLTRRGFIKPYYAVHVIHNALIVLFTAPDVYLSFTEFQWALSYLPNMAAVDLCFALHLYHIINYWSVLHPDDWLHHGLMIGVALPLSLSAPSGTLMGLNLFFTTGLPGGLSYALLFAERNGWITRATEKRWNLPIHKWIRAPGCVAHATLTMATVLGSADPWFRVVGFLVATLTYWNGVYFLDQVYAAANRQVAE